MSTPECGPGPREFFLRPGETHEARFKRVCNALLDQGIFPSPTTLTRNLPNHTYATRNLNGRESRWRAEVLSKRGYVRVEGHGYPWRWKEAEAA